MLGLFWDHKKHIPSAGRRKTTSKNFILLSSLVPRGEDILRCGKKELNLEEIDTQKAIQMGLRLN